MTNSQRLSTVRQRLTRWLADQSTDPDVGGDDSVPAKAILSESILIRDGFYCGRRFDLGAFRAVWFLEEDVLKIFSRGGELKCVLAGDQLADPAENQDDAPRLITMPSPPNHRPSAPQPSAGSRSAGPPADVQDRRAA